MIIHPSVHLNTALSLVVAAEGFHGVEAGAEYLVEGEGFVDGSGKKGLHGGHR